MSSTEEQLAYATLLAGYEGAMAGLYKAYARYLPTHKATWQRLAADELQHEEWLRVLGARLADGSVQLTDQHMMSVSSVLGAVERVGHEEDRAELDQVTVAEAIQVAYALENEMLEKSWFKFLDSDAPELRRVFQALESETTQHLAIVEALLRDEPADPGR